MHRSCIPVPQVTNRERARRNSVSIIVRIRNIKFCSRRDRDGTALVPLIYSQALGHSLAIARHPARKFGVPLRSGRIEARIGLRMMPTFPRSPLSFRTASFPQYGWKAGCPSGAFLGDRRLKPAPGIRRPPSSLHPPFVHFVVATVVRSESGLRTRSCTAMRWNTPPTPGALARVRVVVSRSVIT